MSTQTENPTAQATARFVRVTPMKARRVLDLIRGKDVDEALDILRFAPQSASDPVYKVLASAVANATNNLGVDRRTLVVNTAFADEGPSQDRLCLGVGVDVCGVECRDPLVECLAYARGCGILLDLRSVRQPVAVGNL